MITGSGNARRLRGVPVSPTPPTDGQGLVYASSGNAWGPSSSGGSGPSFSDAEVPSGTVDGSNATFTLAHSPSPALSLVMVRNGVVQQATLDYTLSAATVTFLSGAIPQTGDVLQAWYRH